MTIRYDGTYVSDPIPWAEWHAGAHMHGSYVHFWRFYPNGTYASCSRETDHELDFYAFTEALTKRKFAAAMRGRAGQVGCGHPLVEAGKYHSISNGVHCTFGPILGRIIIDRELVFTDMGLKWLKPDADSESVDLKFKPAR